MVLRADRAVKDAGGWTSANASGILARMTRSPFVRPLLLVSVALAALGASGCAGAHHGPGGYREAWGRSIAVTATGRVSVAPDVGVATLGAEGRAPTLAEATADVARRMAAVLARLKALGVQDADIATVAYSVSPIAAPRRTEEEPTRILAYHALNLVRVKVRALDGIGRVLDEAVAAGANAVRDVQFTLADPAAAEARARVEAVREATARAQQLAAAAGRQLGELVWLSEGRADQPGPRPVAYAARMATGPGPIETGQLEVAVTVEARWRLAR